MAGFGAQKLKNPKQTKPGRFNERNRGGKEKKIEQRKEVPTMDSCGKGGIGRVVGWGTLKDVDWKKDVGRSNDFCQSSVTSTN